MEIGNLNLPAAQFNSKKASTPVGGGGGGEVSLVV